MGDTEQKEGLARTTKRLLQTTLEGDTAGLGRGAFTSVLV